MFTGLSFLVELVLEFVGQILAEITLEVVWAAMRWGFRIVTGRGASPG